MNPEFKRNLWLEISPGRLIIMPIVLGLIAALSFVLDTQKPLQTLFIAACALCAVLVIGWGSFSVITSINSEVTERTWDQQRLSALTPWEMAWGKLLGSTAYAWYGGLLCALVALLAALILPDSLTRCVWLLTGLLAAVASHAWLMASRLHTMDTQAEKSTSMAGRLFGLFMLVQFLPIIFLYPMGLLGKEAAQGSWWNLALPLEVQNFVLVSLFLVLGLLALWRSMSKQLMLRTTPWAWVLGIVAVGLIIAGYALNSKMSAMPLLVIAMTAIGATYFALFTEKNNLLVWRAVVFHAKRSSAHRFWQELPLWPVSFAVAVIFAGFYSFMGKGGDASMTMTTVTSVVWMALLHTLRDCGIYLFFAFRNTTRKPLGMTLLTLFILGVILPAIASFTAAGSAELFEPMYGIKNLFEGQHVLGLTAWLAMLVHLIVVGALVMWRWSSAPKSE
jgi:hypothetical protein